MSKLTSLPVKQVFFSSALILGSVAVFALMLSSREAPPTKPPKKQFPLVNVSQVHRQDVDLLIKGYGTVKPKVEIDIVPQVSGRVIALQRDFKTGGKFVAEEALVTIDPQDYQLALNKAEASIAQAQLQLDIELAEADVKRRERATWKKQNPLKTTPALALHEQHVKRAQANLIAAKVDLQKAELNLARTQLSVPFHGRVVTESVDVGQYVVAGKSLARVYGVDVLEVQVPLADEKLSLFKLASDYPDDPSPVKVTANFGGKKRVWHGVVNRTEGVVDQRTRLINVVIEVKMDKQSGVEGKLLPGMFVDVAIEGQTIANVIPVPRNSIRENNTVWMVRDDNLEIREVNVAYSDHESAYVATGINSGEMIITSLLGVVADSMQVRVHRLDEQMQYKQTASVHHKKEAVQGVPSSTDNVKAVIENTP